MVLNTSNWLYALAPAGTFTVGFNVAVVYQVTGSFGNTSPYARGLSNSGGPMDNYTTSRYFSTGSTFSPYDHRSGTNPTIFLTTLPIGTSVTYNEYVNGVLRHTFTPSAVDSGDRINVGSRNDNVTRFPGRIGEIMFYDTNFTETQRQQLEGYLAWKWNILGTRYEVSPRSVPGMLLWLDAQDSNAFIGTGSNITVWRDKSGRGSNATATGAPSVGPNINGLPAVQCTSGSFLGGNISITGTTFTLFAVATTTRTLPNAGADQRLVSFANGTNVDLGRVDGATILNAFPTSSIANGRTSLPIGSNPIVTNVPFVVTSMFDGTNGGIWFNSVVGARAPESAPGTFAITKYGIGNQANPTGQAWDGYIGEVIVYNTAVAAPQRTIIEYYLAGKWGLLPSFPRAIPRAYVPTLPAGHGYRNGAPYTRLFNPVDIPGCALWLDGADVGSMVLSGSSVTQWGDKSGNGYNFSQISGLGAGDLISNAINGNPAVSFTASDQVLSSSTFPLNASSSGYSIFTVTRQNDVHYSANGYNYILSSYGAGNAGNGLFYGTSPTNFLLTANGTAGPTFGFNDLNVNTPNTLMNSVQLTSIAVNGSVLTPYLNGIAMGTKTGTCVAVTGISVGNAYAPGGGFTYQAWGGVVAEVLIYNAILTQQQRQKIEQYLAWKWGINIGISRASDIPNCALWLDAADSNSISLSGTGTAQLNVFVTTTAQNVSYTGSIATVSSFSRGTCVMNGPSVGIPARTANPRGLFAPSATVGRWYAFIIEFDTCKVVLVQFALAGATLTVQGISARYSSIIANFLSPSASGTINDSRYAGYTVASIATSPTTGNYGVASFLMDFNSVSQWNDKSGNGRHAIQATTTRRPVLQPAQQNLLPAIKWDGVDDNLTGSLPYPTDGLTTLFVVYNVTVASGDQRVFDINGNNYGNFGSPQSSATADVILWQGTGGLWTQLAASTGWRIYSVNYAGTSSAVWRNGFSQALNSIGTLNPTPTGTTYTLGNISTGANSGQFSGQIGELILYTGNLVLSDRQQIEKYLSRKWGIQSTVSSSLLSNIPPRAAGFIPPLQTNLSVWLDAADDSMFQLGGSSVNVWNDKSSNAMVLSSGARPTRISNVLNGLPVVSFATTQNLSSTTTLTLGPTNTWALVFNSSTGGNFFIAEHSSNINNVQGSYFLGANFDLYAMNRTGVLSTWKRYQDSSGQGVPPFNTNTWYIAVVSDNNTNGGVFFRRNGVTRTISNVNAFGALTGNITSNFFINHRLSANVNIAELLVYNRGLSLAEVQTLEGYLASKWGLQGSLPSTHPYVKITP